MSKVFKMLVVFLLFVLRVAHGFDFVVDSFRKYVDPGTPPCDNFYRHSCKLGSPEDLFPNTFDKLVSEIASKNQHVWDNYVIMNEFMKAAEHSEGMVDQISSLYQELCKTKGNTTLFLDQLEFTVFNNPTGCDDRSCYQYILEDPNCHRGTLHFKDILHRDLDVNETSTELIDFYQKIVSVLQLINNINVHLDEDVRDGIDLSRQFLDDMKLVVKEWIKDTPWVINNQVLNSTITTLWPTVLEESYGVILRDSIDTLTRIEMAYRDCQASYKGILMSNMLCSIFLMKSEETTFMHSDWFSSTNAFIAYPKIALGFGFYYVAQNSEDMAAKLGFTGPAVGHELSHMLIKSTPDDYLTYFSDESRKCIQDQFNSTCETFKEESCITIDEQFDDSGADVLGFQLAYNLLVKHYGNNLNDVYTPLGVTHQQLFFYATALSFCEGLIGSVTNETGPSQHPSSYIRVNAMISQLPEFRDAFQCSDESRMMKSAGKQCIIYGKNAPENKKF